MGRCLDHDDDVDNDDSIPTSQTSNRYYVALNNEACNEIYTTSYWEEK